MLRIVRHDDGVAAPREQERVRIASTLVEHARQNLTARKFTLLVDTLRSYEAGAISEGHADVFVRHILLSNEKMTAEYESLMKSQRPLSFDRFHERLPPRDSLAPARQ